MDEIEEKSKTGKPVLKKYVLPVALAALLAFLFFGFTFWFIKERPSLTVFDTSVGCAVCHRREAGKMSHSPYARAQCLGCHLEHGQKKKEMLRKPLAVACFTCHIRTRLRMDGSYRHNPFVKGNCIACHEPHVSDEPVLLTASQENLCVACHRTDKDRSWPYQHQPVVKRQCMSCHSGHSSDYKALVRGNGEELCFNCHRDIARKSTERVQHEPFDGADCTVCHRPHGSNNSALLNKSTPNLCYNCHPDISLTMDQKSHHPVPEGQLDCQSCHDPHANKYESLLPKHAEKDSPGCLACHVSHGSDSSPLLSTSIVTLCTNCHPTFISTVSSKTMTSHSNAEQNHPLLVQDPLTKGPLTCTSSCHKKLVFSSTQLGQSARIYKVAKSDFCTSCHSGHAEVKSVRGLTGKSSFHVQYDPNPKKMTSDAICLQCHPEMRNRN